MYKETIISIITVIVILILNFFTENYTKDTVSELTGKMIELRQELSDNNIKNKDVTNRMKDIFIIWEKRYKLLAYYLEHDELEKVETNLTSLKGEIETKEYPEAISEIDRIVFILRHIEEKNKIDLKNIF